MPVKRQVPFSRSLETRCSRAVSAQPRLLSVDCLIRTAVRPCPIAAVLVRFGWHGNSAVGSDGTEIIPNTLNRSSMYENVMKVNKCCRLSCLHDNPARKYCSEPRCTTDQMRPSRGMLTRRALIDAFRTRETPNQSEPPTRPDDAYQFTRHDAHLSLFLSPFSRSLSHRRHRHWQPLHVPPSPVATTAIARPPHPNPSPLDAEKYSVQPRVGVGVPPKMSSPSQRRLRSIQPQPQTRRACRVACERCLDPAPVQLPWKSFVRRVLGLKPTRGMFGALSTTLPPTFWVQGGQWFIETYYRSPQYRECGTYCDDEIGLRVGRDIT
jgi:hypothetical protein